MGARILLGFVVEELLLLLLLNHHILLGIVLRGLLQRGPTRAPRQAQRALMGRADSARTSAMINVCKQARVKTQIL